MENKTLKIIVTGSLGHIGRPLTVELVEKGHQVTVITSNAEKRQEIEALGATAAVGSLEDTGFLGDVFAGADAVFAMVPPNYTDPDPIEYYRRLGGNYAGAVQQAGVKRVVHLSSYGAHLEAGSGFILGAHHVEGLLNELSDVEAIHLRPGYFYYNLYAFADMIKAQGIIGANYGGDDKLILVAPTDIAAAAAEELTSAETNGKVRYVVSDEQTANETARVLGAALGRPELPWLTFSDEDVLKNMKAHGMPSAAAALYVELGAAIHSGILGEDYELHKPAEFGKIKLEDFAAEFAAGFNE